MRKNKYLMYELFELLATVDLLKGHFNELNREIEPCWQRRMEFVFSKIAIQHAWQSHMSYASNIYRSEFIQCIQKVIANTSMLESPKAAGQIWSWNDPFQYKGQRISLFFIKTLGLAPSARASLHLQSILMLQFHDWSLLFLVTYNYKFTSKISAS